MRRGNNRPDATFVPRYRGKGDPLREDTIGKELIGELHCFGSLTNNHGGNRCLRDAGVKAQLLQLLLEEAGILPHTVDQRLSLVGLQQVDRGDAGGCHGGWMRRREEERTGTMFHKLAQRLVGRYIASDRSDGLGERADRDIPDLLKPKVMDGSAAVWSEDTRGMRIVNHCNGLEGLGKLGDAR